MTGQLSAGKWADFLPRLGSAIVLIGVGGLALWAGGLWIRLFLVLSGAVMVWELIRMTRDHHLPHKGHEPVTGAGLMALTLFMVLVLDWRWALLIPLGAVFWLAGRNAGPRVQSLAPLYAAAIGVTAYTLTELRETEGLAALLWLIGVVVISDIAGYLIGRLVGGPKFWPKISPKKTWSGTAAGWIGAAALGAGFAAAGHVGWSIVPVSVVVALAGQLGDIAESALKRQAGIKDSSNLIPGHGGFLDRFDAVIGAALVTSVLTILGLMPVFGG